MGRLPGLSQLICRQNLRKVGIGLVLCMGISALTRAADSLPVPGSETMARYTVMSLDDVFAAVATRIRFEPYTGILRGPAATALARGGNASDQALLLADILKAKGYRVRFVRGTLAGKNLETLILGMYPPDLPKMSFPPEYLPFDPFAQKDLMTAARDHVWLEVDQGDGSWLPLDPAFPRARVGEAYAKAEARFDALPDTMYQNIVISLHEETVGGKVRILGRLEGRTADLGLQPLSLTETGITRFKPANQKKSKSAGDIFSGALSGEVTEKTAEPEKPESPQPLGVVYRRKLLSGGDTTGMADSIVFDDNPKSEIRREWLRFEIHSPGGQPVVVERDLFAADAPGASGKRPALVRRFGIVVLPGPIDPDGVNPYAVQLNKTINLKDVGSHVEKLAAAKSPGRAELNSASELFDSVGLITGHLLGLRLAAESTRMGRQIAYVNGVTFSQSLPRIIIVSSASSSASSFETSIDMRLDQVDAWPYPGNVSRQAEYFQTARGVQNTMLESRFIERTLGLKEAANTANLIAHVKGGQAAMLVFTQANVAQLGRVEGLSPYSRQRIEASLKSGREVIIPPKPETLAGRARFGWWEREPASGRIIGVMDDGLHSAMADYSVNTEEIGLNDDTGYVIGLIVGATATETLLAAKVLENGTITPELIADIEKRMEKLQCLSCPEASAKASAGASVSAGISGSCWEFKKEAKAEKEAGVEAKVSFCEKYTKGMSCASKLILNAYKKAPVLITTEAEAKAHMSASVKLPCE